MGPEIREAIEFADNRVSAETWERSGDDIALGELALDLGESPAVTARIFSELPKHGTTGQEISSEADSRLGEREVDLSHFRITK